MPLPGSQIPTEAPALQEGAVSEKPEAVVVPVKSLVANLRQKKVGEIVSILENPETEKEFGPFQQTLGGVAKEFEAENVRIAYQLHRENWMRFEDPDSLVKLPRLGFLAGEHAEAVKFLKIFDFLQDSFEEKGYQKTPNIADVLSCVGIAQGGMEFVESVLAKAVAGDPGKTPWVSAAAAKALISESRNCFGMAVPSDPEKVPAHLRHLEFRALSLLDAGEFANYVRTLSDIAKKFPGETVGEILFSYALLPPSAVADAGFRLLEENGTGIMEKADTEAVPKWLFRRMTYAVYFFASRKYFPVLEELAQFFETVGNSETAERIRKTIRNVQSREAFFAALPKDVWQFRETLHARMSQEFGEAHYPRIRITGLIAGKTVTLAVPVSVAYLSDAVAFGVPGTIVGPLSEAILEHDLPKATFSYLGWVLYHGGHFKESIDMLSKAGTTDPETVALLLRALAEYPAGKAVVASHLSAGTSVSEKEIEYVAWSRIQSVAEKCPDALAGEML
jgi:hypothetical protein